MKVNTKHFGEIEIDEKDITYFDDGIIGFKEYKRYVLLENTNEPDGPFKWLQCIDNGDLCFALVNPFIFYPEYDIEIPTDVIMELGELPENSMNIYAIVVVPEDVTKMTANLKAPVIINSHTNKGLQGVINTDTYSIRHYIFDEINKRLHSEGGEEQC